MNRWVLTGLRSAGSLAVTVAVAACAGAPVEIAPLPTLPAADAIIARYVKAIGGASRVDQRKGEYARGRIELPAQGITGDLEVFSLAPNKLLVTTDITGLGVTRTGYDGIVGWSVNPALGPMVFEGRMLDQLRQQADVRGPLHPEEFIASVETMERTDFEGSSCYKVKVTTQWGEEYFEYFEVETGLLAGMVRTQASPMGEIEATSVLSDYRDIAGMLVPMKIVQRMLGMEQVITTDSVAVRELDGAMFELPPEIKVLVDVVEQEKGNR